jgi:hypothetical protein
VSEVPSHSYLPRDQPAEEGQDLNWPPYFCSKCWAMRFYYNTFMAQCFYCSHIILRRTLVGSTDRHSRGLADDP